MLNFASSAEEHGFRLHRLEVYNWGTFNQKVWSVNPDGFNAFATGDVGSGKSTLVDALTTLLVPPRKIVYNKAAGADTKERDLTTYIRGAYKTEKVADSHRGKATFLRDERSYSAILAVFRNVGLSQSVSVAQVFRANASGGNERFWLVGERELSIATDLKVQGSSLSSLKRTLRKDKQIEVHESFSAYSTHFRRLMGIRSEQALDLFFQTVSMKSVENLTEFVREHMLERWPVEEAIEEQCRNFEDLDRLHEMVVKARQQIAILRPLSDACEQYDGLRIDASNLRDCRNLLSPFFSLRKVGLFQSKLSTLETKLAKIEERLEKSNAEKDALSLEQDTLRERIHEKGGSRLQTVGQRIEAESRERDSRSGRADRYRNFAALLGLAYPDSPESFVENKEELTRIEREAKEQKESQRKRSVDLEVGFRKHLDEAASLEREIVSLRSRKTNIPSENLSIRSALANALGVPVESLPFAGELLQVKAEYSAWSGAAERVLRPFALSMLVPVALYGDVTKYVNETNLKGKLVYYRVDTNREPTRAPKEERSLVNRISIKEDSPFRDWLWDELCQRFDYACCDRIEDFQRHSTAITLQGQVKSGGKRHEKDDRFSVTDRSRNVLGWENKEKLEAFEDQLEKAKVAAQNFGAQIAESTKESDSADNRAVAVQGLKLLERYEEIDWQASAICLQALVEEKRQLEAGNKDLQSLRKQVEEAREKEKLLDSNISDANGQAGGLRNEIENTREFLKRCTEESGGIDTEKKNLIFPRLEALGIERGLLDKLDLNNVDKRERELREFLTADIDAIDQKIKRKGESIVGLMGDFLHRWREEALDVDASLDSRQEFREILDRLEREDLPRHEERFKKKLNEDTINGIALFQEKLESESRQIRQKIDAINDSLRQIDYTPGSYIRLLSLKSNDPEIADFSSQLRQVISYSTGESDGLYTEARFLAVKSIIARFKGREGFVDADRRWKMKVADVRNWYHFAASELWRSDGSEKEYHPDSGGKSGGQKEKLAYTVLGAALAYQFALSGRDGGARTFRLVVIDEAFGRGSDESTRYALELFKKLDLQLFIVTPLQKVNVIENYVQRVHFAHNFNGMESQVRNLTLEQYRKERDAHDSRARSAIHQESGERALSPA